MKYPEKIYENGFVFDYITKRQIYTQYIKAKIK